MADFDMDGAAASVAEGLGLGVEREPAVTDPVEETPRDEPIPETPVEAPVETPVEAKPAKPVPGTWPKEMHEHWAKTPAEVQDYWERREKEMLEGLQQYKGYHGIGKAMTETVAPYMPMIEQAGLDPQKAVSYLFAAHARLTQGSEESRRAAYEQLGRDLGFVGQQQDPNTPPEIKQALERLNRLEGALTQREQQQYQEARSRVSAQVDAFAKEHPEFDEVSEEVAAFIRAGHDLEKSFEMALYANPVAREKQLARIRQEAESAALAKAKEEAEKVKKLTSTNVRSRDTGRAPTEPLGKMEDTMRDTLRSIKERAH